MGRPERRIAELEERIGRQVGTPGAISGPCNSIRGQMTALGLGCVKTPKFDQRVEIFASI
jgi:hypothetical protein